MKSRVVASLVAVVLMCLPAAAQTVDEVIAKNVEAHGGLAKLRAIQSIRMTGRMVVGPGMEAPLVMEVKRPKSVRTEFTFQGMTGVSAYDGKTGWQIMPFGGKTDPEPIPAEQLKDVEEQADFEGALVDYKAKGHQVELLGKESVEGAECYKLKLTRKGGDIVYIYIDTDSNLEIKAEGKRTIRGTEVEYESSLGDYKEVGGVMFAHVIESGAKGSPQRQKLIIEKVEINPTIDDARFKMPEVPKPPEAPKPPQS
jgi:outer membrane lipoprotein-sorting protein